MTSRRGMHLGAITNLFVRCREFHAPTELQMRNTWQLFNLRSTSSRLQVCSATSTSSTAMTITSTRVKRCRDYTYIPASSPNEEYAIIC